MELVKGTLIGQRSFKLVSTTWKPDGPPKAVVILVHGYGEHTGRYRHVIRALVEDDYLVYTLDLRGHGESEGLRAYVERFDYFVDDVHLLVRQAREAYPTLPTFMLGHSMGALIAVRYVLQHQSILDGLIVSGAALQIGDDVSPIIKRLSGVLAMVVPKVPIVAASARGSDSVLSRDPLVQEAMQADPLCYRGKLRARMGHEMMKAAIDARLHASEIALPLLVMHGAEDRLTNPNGSILLYEQARSTDKTLKLWEGCRHEIFNEPEKEEVIAYLLNWLDQRMSGIALDTMQPAAVGA